MFLQFIKGTFDISRNQKYLLCVQAFSSNSGLSDDILMGLNPVSKSSIKSKNREFKIVLNDQIKLSIKTKTILA